MKIKTIIGVGVAGLICSIVGSYNYWVITRLAAFLAGYQGDNSLSVLGWRWFLTLCIGVALLLASGISLFVGRRRKSGRLAD